jgi:hypothetical protein
MTDVSPLLVGHTACNVRFEETAEFDGLGRQLSSPVANLIKFQSNQGIELRDSYLAIPGRQDTKRRNHRDSQSSLY